jgi:hypothetical protein
MKVLILLLIVGSYGCYPTKCNPSKDPLQCQCPNGPCGPYPARLDGGVR